MTFSNKIFELQGKYPKDVILIKNGIFFVAVGKDALFLNEKLKLKCTCFGNEICKVGFLVKSAENYINNMKKLEIPFRMYILDENRILKYTKTVAQKVKKFGLQVFYDCYIIKTVV